MDSQVREHISGGDKLYRQLCGQQGIGQEEMGLPMLLTPEGAAVGEEDISARIRDLIRESCGIAGTVWYYHRPDCKDCQRMSGTVQEAAAHPQYSFVEIDVTDTEAKEAFIELLEDLNIPREEWEVPFLYDGSTWLSGWESIEADMEEIFPPGY